MLRDSENDVATRKSGDPYGTSTRAEASQRHSASSARIDSTSRSSASRYTPLDRYDSEEARPATRHSDGLGALAWHDDIRDVTYHYHATPLTYSCPFILSQELCERLAYYGMTPTLKIFLKKTLRTTDSGASAYLGVFQGTMYLTPVLSAIVSDTYLGAFRTILLFSLSYVVGLCFLLMATFDRIAAPWMVHLGLLVFVCLGAGGIKSCVNVFGAQQFHPLLQKNDVTSFFTYFYASINIGSVVGGFLCPQLAESVSYSVAYLIPVTSFTLATIVFACGSRRYVKMLPRGSPVVECFKLIAEAVRRRSFAACKSSQGGPFDDSLVLAVVALLRLLPLCALEVPFLVAYNQMTTAFLTQAEKMQSTIFGVAFAPALMQGVDPIVVILTSLVVEGQLYPRLRARGTMPSVLTRFFIGNLLGALAVLCAFVVELVVMQSPLYSVSIWAQVPQFAFIASGEVFLISTGYEVAFTYAPTELKTVSSACNLLFFAIAGYLSGGLFIVCSSWMPNFDSANPSTYQQSHYDYYFLVLAAACLTGCVGSMMLRSYFATMKPYHNADPAACSTRGRGAAASEMTTTPLEQPSCSEAPLEPVLMAVETQPIGVAAADVV